MASIKVKFRPSSSNQHEGSIYYQIIHERKARQILSGHKIFVSEWDARHSMLTISDNIPSRRAYITSLRRLIHSDIERIYRIANNLDESALPYTIDDLIREYQIYTHDYTLFNFMERLILKLRHNGRIRTSETYRSTLNNFSKFRNGHDIMLDNITAEIMESYESWHKRRGITLNTISFYTRILRAVYNRAVDEKAIEDRKPFRHVYTGIEKTVKRALPIVTLRKIKSLNLTDKPALGYARDMFMLSFYLRGMSFIDMAFLRKNDLKNGYITYRRRKTGQLQTIRWTKEMQAITDRYPENESDYLLPIIRRKGLNERCTYRNAAYNINHNLKKIGYLAGLDIPLTLYVARHSWASAAKSKGIPLPVISEGMGHNSETTTRIYLASLDTSTIDRANNRIIRALD